MQLWKYAIRFIEKHIACLTWIKEFLGQGRACTWLYNLSITSIWTSGFQPVQLFLTVKIWILEFIVSLFKILWLKIYLVIKKLPWIQKYFKIYFGLINSIYIRINITLLFCFTENGFIKHKGWLTLLKDLVPLNWTHFSFLPIFPFSFLPPSGIIYLWDIASPLIPKYKNYILAHLKKIFFNIFILQETSCAHSPVCSFKFNEFRFNKILWAPIMCQMLC